LRLSSPALSSYSLTSHFAAANYPPGDRGKSSDYRLLLLDYLRERFAAAQEPAGLVVGGKSLRGKRKKDCFPVAVVREVK